MQVIDAQQVDSLLDHEALAEALAEAFRGGVKAPTRHHHTIERPDGTDSGMLLMPAWTDFQQRGHSDNGFIGVKIATVSPDNNITGQPAVMATYLLADGRTGEPLALIDGQALTLWRTATASALAGRFLAPVGTSTMTMIGAGKLAPHLIRAHASMHPIETVHLWNRNHDHALELAAQLSNETFETIATEDRSAAIAGSNLVSAATISADPLIEGIWLKPGTHVDLVGAYTPDMRECDDETVRRSSLFVDTFDGALTEGGDLVQPLETGLITRSDIAADLAMLCRGDHPGRTGDDDITLFKSTGAALRISPLDAWCGNGSTPPTDGRHKPLCLTAGAMLFAWSRRAVAGAIGLERFFERATRPQKTATGRQAGCGTIHRDTSRCRHACSGQATKKTPDRRIDPDT